MNSSRIKNLIENLTNLLNFLINLFSNSFVVFVKVIHFEQFRFVPNTEIPMFRRDRNQNLIENLN